jgi:peptide/nickel transport system substrate-binding protein
LVSGRDDKVNLTPPVIRRRRFIAAGTATLAAPHVVSAQIGRLLKFIPQSDLSVLDPIWSAAYVVRNHAMMVFDTLYGMDGAYRIQPQMADGHRVEDDGKTWLITLRDGLLWHDGDKVLARDCVASVRRWGARDGFGQTLMAATEELTATDDRTIRFRLKRPFPLLTAALGKAGSNICAMMPERLANTDPFKQMSEMTGSGPFRFIAKDRVAGSLIAYERNAAYVPRADGAPSFTAGPKVVHVDRVEWHVLPDPATAAAAMRTGEHDWWEAPTFDLLPMLREVATLTVPPANPLGFLGGIRFNHLQPPFNNPALRRALLGAVVQEDFMTAAATGDRRNWATGVGVFSPESPMANAAGMEVLTGARDLEAVKRAVVASGYRGEKAVVPVPSDFPNLLALAEVGVDMLQKAGINVEARYTDWGTMLQLLAKTEPAEQGGWSAFHTYWSGLDQFDPAVHVWIRGNGRAAARGWPESARLEALRDAWLSTSDLADQQRIAADIQRQVFVDVAYIPVGQILPAWVYQRNMTDVLSGYALFWNVRKG